MSRASSTSGPRLVRSGRYVAVGLLVLGVLAGCGSGGDSGSSDSAKAPTAGGAADSATREGPGGENSVTARATGMPEGARQSSEIEQEIIYTGSITLRVKDREEAAERATKVAEDHGGNRFSLEADLTGDGDTVLVLKVQPDEFDAAMADLAELGSPRDTKVDQEDVTDQVVDLEGRLDTATRSAERLRELLTAAVDVNAIVAVEQQLAHREAEIESLEGQLRVLESRAGLATITVKLTERSEAKVDKDIPGFGTGLSRGFVAVVNVLAIGLTILGFLLPFLVVLAPFAVGYRVWRRRNPKKPREPMPLASSTTYWDGTQWRQTTGPMPAPATSKPTRTAPVPNPAPGPTPNPAPTSPATSTAPSSTRPSPTAPEPATEPPVAGSADGPDPTGRPDTE